MKFSLLFFHLGEAGGLGWLLTARGHTSGSTVPELHSEQVVENLQELD